jgi:hypothetical protein
VQQLATRFVVPYNREQLSTDYLSICAEVESIAKVSGSPFAESGYSGDTVSAFLLPARPSEDG